MFEIVWNVLFTSARKTLKKASSSWLSTYIAPAQKIPIISLPQVCPYYLALSTRSILTARHGVSCDGPADSAHLVTRGIDSTRTTPNDVRCSPCQLQLEWVDGSCVHMMTHAQQHHIEAAVGMKRHWDPREEEPLCALFKQWLSFAPHLSLPIENMPPIHWKPIDARLLKSCTIIPSSRVH